MAVVFLARDLVLERQVAIKVLPPDLSLDVKLIARFQQEAKTAAKLDHPNIIPIYRVESEAGLNYFVMKFVSGNSLEQLLEKGPLPIDLTRRVLRDASLALGHAHTRGIVHRDVKPANIMLEGDGRVILTDFGISKALEDNSALTGTGNIIGTPHYMAPEQAKGLVVDGRADQYALAVVGHQILTGRQPFEGSSHSILYKHVFEAPPRIFEARPDAPTDLCAALDRALSKDVEQRFRTMEDFAAAVSGERTGPRTVVSSAPPLARKAPWFRKTSKRGTAVRRGLLAIGLSAAVGGAAWAGFRPYQEEGVAPSREVVTPVPQDSSPVAPGPASTDSSRPGTQAVAQPSAPSGPSATSHVSKSIVAKKEYALLTVASEPWGTVFLGNKEIGPTPIADYPVPVGTHRLRIEQEGYVAKLETIVVSSPNPIRRHYNLEPAGPP
jgi:serine/threonine-protein kinase